MFSFSTLFFSSSPFNSLELGKKFHPFRESTKDRRGGITRQTRVSKRLQKGWNCYEIDKNGSRWWKFTGKLPCDKLAYGRGENNKRREWVPRGALKKKRLNNRKHGTMEQKWGDKSKIEWLFFNKKKISKLCISPFSIFFRIKRASVTFKIASFFLILLLLNNDE